VNPRGLLSLCCVTGRTQPVCVLGSSLYQAERNIWKNVTLLLCCALVNIFASFYFFFFCILLILFYLSGGIRCSYHCVCSVCLWLLAFYWNKKPLNLARSWSSSVNLLSRFTEMYEETWPIFRVRPLPTNTFCFRIKYDTPGVYYFSEETRFKIDQPG